MQERDKNNDLIEERKLLSKHYGQKEARLRHRLLSKFRIEKPSFWWKERKIWQKISLILAALLVLFTAASYGVGQWYIFTHRHKPLTYGVTFIPNYARYYGIDPEETMDALINDLSIRRFRLVSYWKDIEKTKDQYNFNELDWQFKKAEDANAKVSLAIGLRQPRWPECHPPTWAENIPKSEWYPELKEFMGKVIERYKNSPALESYQLENEYFLKVFGECKDFERERLVDEFNFVKQQDPHHPVVISRSNNAWGIPLYAPRADVFAISIYKRVWDKTITKRYFEYPFPAWFYASLAGWGKIFTGRDLVIHELQAEPWTPSGGIKDNTIAEQNKSLNADRLEERFRYGKATGMRTIDLWGAEMWYWRKVALGDSSLWDAAKRGIKENQCSVCY